MAFTPIAESDFNGKGARSLPDQPTISAEDLKKKFDEDARDVVAPKVNNLITELEATSAAASLGAVAPTGRTGNTVQALLNDISAAVDAKSTITLSNVATSGVRIATVTINGANTDLKAPQGGHGTMDYDDLTDKPQINSHTLSGNQSSSDLGLADASHTHTKSQITDFPTIPTVTDTYSSSSHDGMSGVAVASAISGITFPVNDAFKKVKVGTYEITASDEDTIEFAQGANVTITPDVGNKKITISATGGGGGGGGDMYMAVYDTNEDGIVNSADTIAGLTATVSELNILDGVTADASEINVLDGITASTAELNILNGVTASTAELNILDGVTATASELNILDGATLTTTELNYVDGVTSAIQTQLNDKAASSHTHTTTLATDAGTSTIDLAANTTYKLTTGGTNVVFKTPPNTGHTMIDNTDLINEMNTAISDGTSNAEVVSAYGVGTWSNTVTRRWIIQATQAKPITTTGIGDFDDTTTYDGWVQIADLKGISALDYDIKVIIDPTSFSGNPAVLGGWRIEDYASDSTKNYGLLCIKFANEIDAADCETAAIGIDITISRLATSVISAS